MTSVVIFNCFVLRRLLFRYGGRTVYNIVVWLLLLNDMEKRHCHIVSRRPSNDNVFIYVISRKNDHGFCLRHWKPNYALRNRYHLDILPFSDEATKPDCGYFHRNIRTHLHQLIKSFNIKRTTFPKRSRDSCLTASGVNNILIHFWFDRRLRLKKLISIIRSSNVKLEKC